MRFYLNSLYCVAGLFVGLAHGPSILLPWFGLPAVVRVSKRNGVRCGSEQAGIGTLYVR